MRTIISGFVLLLVCLIVVPTWAQGYTVIPITAPEFDPDSTDSKVKGTVGQAKIKIQTALRGNSPLTAEEKQLITRFFEEAYFRSWTQPNSATKAGLKRVDFTKSFYGSTSSNIQARPFINTLTLKWMSEYIKPKYHPVVRFNAMLLIGDLKSREYQIGKNDPEVPYSAAFPVIVAALKDKTQSDPVKVAALLGLRKHCELVPNRPANYTNGILDIAKEYIIADEPPAGRSADAHLWMRQQAINIVGVIRSGEKIGEFAGLLDNIITNEDLPLKIRCSAITTKGKLVFDQNTVNQLNLMKESANIGKVALEAVKADIEWFDTAMTQFEQDKLNPGGYGGECSGYGGGYGAGDCGGYGADCGGCGDCDDFYGGGCGGYGEPDAKPKKVVRKIDPILNRIQLTFRRRMKYHLDAAKQGLVGTAAEAPSDPRNVQALQAGLMRYAKNPGEANAVKRLVDPMVALLNEVDQQDTEEKVLLSEVQSKLEALTREVQKLAAGPKGATPRPAANPASGLPGGGPAALPGGTPAALPGGTPAALPGGTPAALPGGTPAP
ncbi:MAG: hypothetical protein COA78_05115 [Blastopirellula sp.]|nr:MAG: hypothetical protein COA78_05115 [Blastopirellula sp.]